MSDREELLKSAAVINKLAKDFETVATVIGLVSCIIVALVACYLLYLFIGAHWKPLSSGFLVMVVIALYGLWEEWT